MFTEQKQAPTLLVHKRSSHLYRNGSPSLILTRIVDCCRGVGADVIMTSESCRNGTELCSEAIENLEKKYDVVLNIQGDEQLTEPEIIDSIVKALHVAPDAVFSTAVTSLKPEDGDDPNRVKCVVDNRGYTIYISSGLVPYNTSGNVNPDFLTCFILKYSFSFQLRHLIGRSFLFHIFSISGHSMVAHAMELWTVVSDEGEVLAHVLHMREQQHLGGVNMEDL
ncbi:unnamed protein product, partial [Brassica oleracea var. botrytis]